MKIMCQPNAMEGGNLIERALQNNSAPFLPNTNFLSVELPPKYRVELDVLEKLTQGASSVFRILPKLPMGINY